MIDDPIPLGRLRSLRHSTTSVAPLTPAKAPVPPKKRDLKKKKKDSEGGEDAESMSDMKNTSDN
jgi:hypothetical protein